MINMINLEDYGLTPYFKKYSNEYRDLIVARVIAQHKNSYSVVTENGIVLAALSGRYLHTIEQGFYPVVGDFVMMVSDGTTSVIHHLLKRKSLIARKKAGTQLSRAQLIAANVDTVFICTSLNSEFNESRLERYLSLVWSSGATPIVVLTKGDLAEDPWAQESIAQRIAIGVDILITSLDNPNSMDRLLGYVALGDTAVFAGSSGVGKTTLINHLMGQTVGAIGDIQDKGQGRHTTTSRELFLLKNGGCLIDTPGMRELGVDFAEVERTFSDIEAFSEQCRFRDCTHNNEPGCAVLIAIENGSLEPRRLESYRKLKKEVRYDDMNFREIEADKFQEVGGAKKLRKHIREIQKRTGK